MDKHIETQDDIPKLLLVNQEQEEVQLMQASLNQLPADVYRAATSDAAFSLLSRYQFSVVFLAMDMPEMDGYSMAKLIRENPETKNVPIVFMRNKNTKSIDASINMSGMGIIDYLNNPTDVKILNKKVRTFVEINQQRQLLELMLSEYHELFAQAEMLLSGEHVEYQTDPGELNLKKKNHLLVVSPQKQHLQLYEHAGREVNAAAITVATSDEAIELVKKSDFITIVIDMVDAGYDAYELADVLRKYNLFKQVPLLFIANNSYQEISLYADDCGGPVDYLFYPIDPEMVVRKIKLFSQFSQQKKILANLAYEKGKLIEQLNKYSTEINTMTHHDALTNVPNRLGFERALKKTLARSKRHKRLIALLMVNIDHFKSMNDSFGVEVGDKLIREVAVRLKQCVRMGDVVARVDGDEFSIVLDEIKKPNEAGVVAKKILGCLRESFVIDGQELRIAASIGIACYPSPEIDFKDIDMEIHALIKNADIALYQTKRAYRGAYRYFTSELNEEHQQYLGMESALRFALDKNELFLMYQPKISLDSNKINGMEVLVRWEHSTLGGVSPAAFIPVAEDSNLIIPIGYWILEEAFAQYKKWCELGYDDINMALNLSPKQLLDSEFVPRLEKLIEKYDINKAMLEFELTETAIMVDSRESKDALRDMEKMGLKISIDDFGTGYSALSHIKRLPVTCLKIDIDFIRDIGIDVNDEMIIKAIIGLAKNLGMDVVAEGVEEVHQVEFLIKHGCENAQGYYFSKPLAAEEMLLFLNKNK